MKGVLLHSIMMCIYSVAVILLPIMNLSDLFQGSQIICPIIINTICYVKRSLANSSGFNMWRFQTVRGGDVDICFDFFRFIRPDTTYGIPISITSTQNTGHGQSALEKVFNVNNNLQLLEALHNINETYS